MTATVTVGLTVVFLNAGSGKGGASDAQGQIERKFAERGAPVRVELLDGGESLADRAKRACDEGAALLVAGGGDGTVNTVAGAVLGTGTRLGVLPLGTLNHFAKDVGIPLDVDDAIDVLLDGVPRAVDCAEVNGRPFVNNSSLGLYPRLVELRDDGGPRGIWKWVRGAWATARVLRECPQFAVRVDVGGEQVVRRTPLVFIGNNPYQMRGLDAGSREALDTGTLAVYIVRERHGLRLLALVLNIMRGTAHRNGQLEQLRSPSVFIETTATELPVAVDGEVTTIETPLAYVIHPGALQVLVPRA